MHVVRTYDGRDVFFAELGDFTCLAAVLAAAKYRLQQRYVGTLFFSILLPSHQDRRYEIIELCA